MLLALYLVLYLVPYLFIAFDDFTGSTIYRRTAEAGSPAVVRTITFPYVRVHGKSEGPKFNSIDV